MAKTNSTRQAEFRARMREEGKQALHIWVTPEQAAKVQAVINLAEPVLVAPLRVTKPTGKPAPVAGKNPLPVIPTKAPASIAKELKDADTLHKKKLAQIAKLQKDAEGIESWYRQTVASCNRL